ncbi:hypothetical protein OF83DRAFT_74019 [Amylostereum chailletii]|nr:hypothetical protein OF83DRAFT_74019 [Amylostereum chailletii]
MLRVVKVLRQRNISSNALDIAEVKTNKEQCKRLARRAKEALIDIDKCMEGKWEAAPQGLLDNVMKLIEALDSIHSFMVKPTEKKWLKRFMSKSAIESELTEYTQRLEDVKQRFLISGTITMQLTIASMPSTTATSARIDPDDDAYGDDGYPKLAQHEVPLRRECHGMEG